MRLRVGGDGNIATTLAKWRAIRDRKPHAVAHTSSSLGWRVAWRDAALIWTGQHAFILVCALTIGRLLFPASSGVPLAALYGRWVSWDGSHYANIAQHGYASLQLAAFYPLFPLFEHLLAAPVGGPSFAGLLIANVSELAAFGLLRMLFERLTDARLARYALLYLAFSPLAFYFAMPYTESLFLLLSVGVFVAMERRRCLLAGLFAALLVLTRPTGIAILPALLYLLLRWRVSWPRLLTALALPCAALAGFAGYLVWRFGTPLASSQADAIYWHKTLDWPWVAFVGSLNMIVNGAGVIVRQHAIVDVILVGAALACAAAYHPIAARLRLDQEYAIYIWASMLLALSFPLVQPELSDLLASAPRFLLVVFPLYLPLAFQGSRSRAFHLALLTAQLLGMCYLLIVFFAGGFVA